MQRTELLHEFYFRLPGMLEVDWKERAQFFSIAARTMRNILVDHARRRHAAKRGGPPVALTPDPWDLDRNLEIDVLAVHEALDKFAVDYARQARVVELGFSGPPCGRNLRGLPESSENRILWMLCATPLLPPLSSCSPRSRPHRALFI